MVERPFAAMLTNLRQPALALGDGLQAIGIDPVFPGQAGAIAVAPVVVHQ